MKLKTILATGLVALMFAGSANARDYTTDAAKTWNMYEIFNTPNTCLALVRQYGKHTVGGKTSYVGKGNTLTIYNFTSGERTTIDYTSGVVNEENDLSSAYTHFYNGDWSIKYSTPSTDYVSLRVKDETTVYKFYSYTNSKGTPIEGYTVNDATVFPCSNEKYDVNTTLNNL